jgi:hypothetical protein
MAVPLALTMLASGLLTDEPAEAATSTGAADEPPPVAAAA